MPAYSPQVIPAERPPRKTSEVFLWVALALLPIFGAASLFGLAFYREHNEANRYAAQFHSALNAGQFEQICARASRQFRDSESQDKVVAFLQMVHTKLGQERSATMTGIRVNATTHGTYVITSYSTRFDNGPAAETFTWLRQDGALELVGYHVDSDALIVN